MLGKLDSHMEKNEIRTLPNTIHKINSKWMKDLDIIPDTIKLLEENIGQTLSDISNSNVFSDPSPRVMTIKTKINKWDPIKLKSFCKHSKGNPKQNEDSWLRIQHCHELRCPRTKIV